jgi:hypothetical protein
VLQEALPPPLQHTTTKVAQGSLQKHKRLHKLEPVAKLTCMHPPSVVQLPSITTQNTKLRGYHHPPFVCMSRGLGIVIVAASGGGTAAAKEAGDVRRFLNRLLGLRVSCQTLLFSYFFACLEAEVAAAKRDGKYSGALGVASAHV